MARSVPVENLLPQNVYQSSTTSSNLLKQPNGELLVSVDHGQLRTMASEMVDPIDWSHPPSPWTVPSERLVHSINQCNLSGNRTCNRSMRGNHLANAATQGIRFLRDSMMVGFLLERDSMMVGFLYKGIPIWLSLSICTSITLHNPCLFPTLQCTYKRMTNLNPLDNYWREIIQIFPAFSLYKDIFNIYISIVRSLVLFYLFPCT